MADPTAQPKRRWPLGKYGLSITLAVVFVGSWIGQFVVQMIKVGNEAREHQQAFSMAEFWPDSGNPPWRTGSRSSSSCSPSWCSRPSSSTKAAPSLATATTR